MKRIGEILIEHGSITHDQLKQALERQKSEPSKLLGAILIAMGFVSEEDIVVALATQFNVPYLPVGNFTLNETTTKLIPQELIQKFLCIPLDRIGNLLTVVMADPTNEDAIREIESAANCKVQAFVATATEIAAVIRENLKISLVDKVAPKDQVSQVSFRSALTQRSEEEPSGKK
jgi:type IV pilus assembly protein PilB